MPQWGDPGITEQLLIAENEIQTPGENGGTKTLSLQRAGFVKRLRFYAQSVFEQTAATGAPSKSVYGPLGAFLRNLQISANGKIPLFDMSGIGLTVYNEVQNRDGNVLATPPFLAGHNIAAGKDLFEYTTPATGVVTYTTRYPFELNFSIPVHVRGIVEELGLWLLQNQAINLTIDANFNALYASAASKNNLYSGGTGVVGTTTGASTRLEIERELYAVPQIAKAYPDLRFAHQVIEHSEDITGKTARFNIPQAGLILRAVMILLDSSDAFIDWDDIVEVKIVYGANETPISRKGWAVAHEYLHDYGVYAQKGVVVLDFYKWGMDTLKLVRNSELLSNFRLEVELSTNSTGTVKILLDRLVPLSTTPGAT